MEFISSIDQVLPEIMKLLQALPIAGMPQEPTQPEAIRKVWQAVDETRMYLASARGEDTKLNRPNPKLVALWSDASLAISTIDDDLARRLRMKAEYWSDPMNWTSEQVVKARITIDGVAAESRRLVDDLPASTIPAKLIVSSSIDQSKSHSSQSQPIDILLLCALKDEFDEVLSVRDGIIAPGWRMAPDLSGRIVADAQFATNSGVPISIRATYAGYMGREQTQAVASSIICSSSVKCLAMSGICAGRRGEVALGDVIFGERLWSYDSGKSRVESGHETFEYDMLQYRPSEVWVQQMQAVKFAGTPSWMEERPRLTYECQENWVLKCLLNCIDPKAQADFESQCPNWSKVLEHLTQKKWITEPLTLTDQGKSYIEDLCSRFPTQLPQPANFQIHVAPIATGAAVKVDDQLFPKLSVSMRKVLGVEMEASGLAALAEAHKIPAIIAKGVSDFGDKFKDDRYRKFAARASAEALILLLRNSNHLLPSQHEIPVLAMHATKGPVYSSGGQTLPMDLIELLADNYPDTADARALWERAGGRRRDVENNPRPVDLWQRIWIRCDQGAIVTPFALLQSVLADFPNNKIIQKYIQVHAQ
ncbi:Phosphorylase superfamily protein [Trichlorobacter thiogenes]|uniref:Phosphorylase superfamily protein n=1 Tax=Trichlorobacter thiogenes TaxID=115783 RepID=A0A1T4LA31_9BACT|nr:phosphorylase [Trichlorobacter thiogenes]SJZ51470.1 Phosphorylase superfamily protein [Trichlorobacter thiogenes]